MSNILCVCNTVSSRFSILYHIIIIVTPFTLSKQNKKMYLYTLPECECWRVHSYVVKYDINMKYHDLKYV